VTSTSESPTFDFQYTSDPRHLPPPPPPSPWQSY